MNEYTIFLGFDDESKKWYAQNDGIPIILEDFSLDMLINRTKRSRSLSSLVLFDDENAKKRMFLSIFYHASSQRSPKIVELRIKSFGIRGTCKTPVLKVQPLKNAVLQTKSRKTARASAKLTEFCKRLIIYT